MSDQQWTREDFTRRQYQVRQSEEKELDRARRIGVKITIDGRTFIDKQLREPGIFAIVSRPDSDGFDIEIVERNTEPGMGPRYADLRDPEGRSVIMKVTDWMFEALGL